VGVTCSVGSPRRGSHSPAPWRSQSAPATSHRLRPKAPRPSALQRWLPALLTVVVVGVGYAVINHPGASGDATSHAYGPGVVGTGGQSQPTMADPFFGSVAQGFADGIVGLKIPYVTAVAKFSAVQVTTDTQQGGSTIKVAGSFGVSAIDGTLAVNYRYLFVYPVSQCTQDQIIDVTVRRDGTLTFTKSGNGGSLSVLWWSRFEQQSLNSQCIINDGGVEHPAWNDTSEPKPTTLPIKFNTYDLGTPLPKAAGCYQ
jgi:hypothetical protein